MSRLRRATAALLPLLFLIPLLPPFPTHASAGWSPPLSTAFYARTCPRVEEIVQRVVADKQISTPTTAAGTLRLFFHDCLPNGCDASVLVTSNTFNPRAERDADINLSLPGDAFDVVVRAKSALELACPGTVSCADILALAARDLVTMLGGPFYSVPLGRRDATASRAADIDGKLPRPTMTMSQILSLFASRGFSPREATALTGAHTVGFAHCKEFAHRVLNGTADPTLNPRLAAGLRQACAGYAARPTISVFNDIMTPNKFDNMYFRNLPRGLGLLASDAGLMSDPRTAPFARLYAANEPAFFRDFAAAMEKLGTLGVLTGRMGEVRRRCDQFNNIA